MSTSEAQRIVELAERLGALLYGEFNLTSGAKSHYYFDGRLVTLDAEGAYLVGKAFQSIVQECGAEAVAGPAVAAVPMLSAIAMASYLEGTPVPGLIVRSERKQHGTGKLIEGSIREGLSVAVVDDTCSQGGSLLHAIDAVEGAGCRVAKVMCILDRNEGGSRIIRERGYEFVSLLEVGSGGRIQAVRG